MRTRWWPVLTIHCRQRPVPDSPPIRTDNRQGEKHTQKQDDHRADTPRHLRDTDVAAAVVVLGTLRDISPRSRNTHTHGDTRDEESAEQHREIDGKHHRQHTEHIDQQVVSEDKLTSILISQESADDGSYGSTQTVGTDEIEPAKVNLAQPQIVLPKRQTACTATIAPASR